MKKVAIEYPKSKLIFIASGALLKPVSSIFKILLNILKNNTVLKILNSIIYLPINVLYFIYKVVNPCVGDNTQKEIYEKDMRANFKYIFQIPFEKECEIISFVSQTNNLDILKTIKNKALIFSGRNDSLMPLTLGMNLHKLLVNSKIIVTDGSHFNVIFIESFKEMDKFIN